MKKEFRVTARSLVKITAIDLLAEIQTVHFGAGAQRTPDPAGLDTQSTTKELVVLDVKSS